MSSPSVNCRLLVGTEGERSFLCVASMSDYRNNSSQHRPLHRNTGGGSGGRHYIRSRSNGNGANNYRNNNKYTSESSSSSSPRNVSNTTAVAPVADESPFPGKDQCSVCFTTQSTGMMYRSSRILLVICLAHLCLICCSTKSQTSMLYLSCISSSSIPCSML
jgi:hypothetical protein